MSYVYKFQAKIVTYELINLGLKASNTFFFFFLIQIESVKTYSVTDFIKKYSNLDLLLDNRYL